MPTCRQPVLRSPLQAAADRGDDDAESPCHVGAVGSPRHVGAAESPCHVGAAGSPRCAYAAVLPLRGAADVALGRAPCLRDALEPPRPVTENVPHAAQAAASAGAGAAAAGPRDAASPRRRRPQQQRVRSVTSWRRGTIVEMYRGPRPVPDAADGWSAWEVLRASDDDVPTAPGATCVAVRWYAEHPHSDEEDARAEPVDGGAAPEGGAAPALRSPRP